MIGSGTLAVVGGRDIATFTTNSLKPGTHPIFARYGGDSNFDGSTSPFFYETIIAVPMWTAVMASANPGTVGQSVTFTADISPTANPGSPPSGQVNFKDNGKFLGSGTLSLVAGQYVATFPTSSLIGGGHAITATYVGDGNYQPSTSAAYIEEMRVAETTPRWRPRRSPCSDSRCN